MTMANTKQDLAPGLERCFLFDAVEDSYEISGITGRVPEWLRGFYYVNGPARFERAGQRYQHWLDGDGMVCSLHFHEEGIHFTSRFVQTRKLKEEETAGQVSLSGVWHGLSGRPAAAQPDVGTAGQCQRVPFCRFLAGVWRANPPDGFGPCDAGNARGVRFSRQAQRGQPLCCPSEV